MIVIHSNFMVYLRNILVTIAAIVLILLYIFATDTRASEPNNENSLKEQVLHDPDSISRGEKQFNSTCVYCHGNRGSGGRARTLQGRDFDPEYLFKTITEGKKGGMPPWGDALSEKTRWELVAFILSLESE